MPTGTIEAWMSWELAIPFWLEVRHTPQDETTSCHWGQESVRRHPGPSGEPVTVTLLTGHRVTLTAMIHCYTLRLAHQSSLIGEASVRRRWQLTRRPVHLQLGKEWETADGSALSVYLTPSLPTSSSYGCFFHTYPVIISHWKKKWSILLAPWNSFKNIFPSKTPEWLLFSSTVVSKAALKTSYNYLLNE